MKQYLNLLKDILDNGFVREDRTGTGTIALFGREMRFDLTKGFPLVTTKKVFLRGIIEELLWFIQGSTNNNALIKKNVHIWDQWALKKSDFDLTLLEREEVLKENEFLFQQYQMDCDLAEYAFSLSNSPEDKTDTLLKFKHAQLTKRNIPKLYTTTASEGDLGPIYSALWRRWPVNSNEIVFIDAKTGPIQGPVVLPKDSVEKELFVSTYKGDLGIHHDNLGMPFNILEDLGTNNGKNTSFKIQFLKTKAIAITSRPAIRNSNSKILDRYHPTLFGVACLGNAKTVVKREVYDLWYNMITRCYNTVHPTFGTYGGKGVYVSPRWLCFENFADDIRLLPNYENWTTDGFKFQLDKDYYGATCYDVSTTLFVTRDLNLELSNKTRSMKAISPSGDERIFSTKKDLVEWLGISDETFRSYENNRHVTSKLDGWIFEDFTPPPGKLVRKLVFIDQISELMKNLKERPFSRRHVISAWNPEVLPDERISPQENVKNGKAALASCHALFQFYVQKLSTKEREELSGISGDSIIDQDANKAFDDNGIPKYKLSCKLVQRSADCALGIPFNIASYALLTMMIAQCVGMVPGEFIHSLGDTHIYLNAVDGIKEQLTREPFPLPVMKINPEKTDIFNFNIEDFVLEGYQSHPSIKFEVAT